MKQKKNDKEKTNRVEDRDTWWVYEEVFNGLRNDSLISRPFSPSRRDYSSSKSQKKYALQLFELITGPDFSNYFDDFSDMVKGSKSDKLQGHTSRFVTILKEIFRMRLVHHADSRSKAASKDTIAEVLEANGVTYRKVLVLLLMSVLVLVLLFVLIAFAQRAFGAPGMVSSTLSALLCGVSAIGVNKSTKERTTSKKVESKITEKAGNDLKQQWEAKGTDIDFTNRLHSQITGAVLKQQQNFDALIHRIEDKQDEIQININDTFEARCNNLEGTVEKRRMMSKMT